MKRSAGLLGFGSLTVFGAVLAFAGAAQAFTVEGGPGASGAAKGWQDLDVGKTKNFDPDSRFKSENGTTTFKNGNSSFFFGQQPSFDQRYNTENLFNPYARDGR